MYYNVLYDKSSGKILNVVESQSADRQFRTTLKPNSDWGLVVKCPKDAAGLPAIEIQQNYRVKRLVKDHMVELEHG